MIHFESMAKSFLPSWDVHILKDWAGLKLKRWPIFPNDIRSSGKEQNLGCEAPVDDALSDLQPHFIKCLA